VSATRAGAGSADATRAGAGAGAGAAAARFDASLNFHHLRYFWLVAREGSVTRAAAKLRVTQPTVSGQLRLLEETLGEDLFRRDGRKVVLTDVGRTVLRFADEIFSLGDDLIGTVRGRPTGRPMRLAVGVAESVPKAIAYRILEPSFTEPGLRIVCEEDTTERLVRELTSHTLDMVISDEPSLSATSELLGESGVSVFGVAKLARAAKRGFPRSLQDAPMLLPVPGTTLRREIDQWLEERGLLPQVVGEFEDPALMSVFAQAGKGLYVAPDAIETDALGEGRLVRAGRMRPLRQRFYLLTVQRRIVHPTVARLAGAARERLFTK
jgi:LysR family transcriptional activator of nhaA